MSGNPWQLPKGKGRSIGYSVLGACERFGLDPREFDRLSRPRQVELIAYDQVRQAEEAKEFELAAQLGAMCPLLRAKK